jgi:hypothetical protein
LPRNTTQLAGASAVTLSLSGPQVYDIMLNAFSAACNNATDGYVSVPQTQVLGVTTWLIPIAVILKPR